jgi:hypothetical protein
MTQARSPEEAASEEPMSTPPKFDENTKLDFSRFHPLDHSPLGCWRRNRFESIYGRTWHHLKIAWTYKWQGDLRAATLCRLGIRHHYGHAWHRPAPGAEWERITPAHCVWCFKDEP